MGFSKHYNLILLKKELLFGLLEIYRYLIIHYVIEYIFPSFLPSFLPSLLSSFHTATILSVFNQSCSLASMKLSVLNIVELVKCHVKCQQKADLRQEEQSLERKLM